ncbi:MAG TPA: TIGR03435 family protein, partial [Bryobacteraceae bacterium]|nr:TIGR03435 family protein [Bryobacteraceae bacterium]
GYLRTEVLDTTGLEGGWDFTFSFSPAGVLQGGRGQGGEGAPPAAGTAPEAAEPTAALSLFDALNKQLGLKLETQKRSMPVLVIEHLERKPIDN